MRDLAAILFLAVSICCSTNSNRLPETNHLASPYSVSYFKNPDGTMGFDITKLNRPFIHQPTMPAIDGNRGFSNREEAVKVAQLMIHKLDLGIVPPTVSLQEIDSLGIEH